MGHLVTALILFRTYFHHPRLCLISRHEANGIDAVYRSSQKPQFIMRFQGYKLSGTLCLFYPQGTCCIRYLENLYEYSVAELGSYVRHQRRPPPLPYNRTSFCATPDKTEVKEPPKHNFQRTVGEPLYHYLQYAYHNLL